MMLFKNVSFAYNGQRPIFDGLNLSIPSGGACGLLGKNGAGKTTLLKMIAGVLFPSAGSCQVLGQMPHMRRPSFLEQIYFLPENCLLPAIPAEQFLALYATLYPKFDHTLFQNCLQAFDVKAKGPLSALSYGEKKKFLVSFALSTQANLLLFDEPTNGFDIPSKDQFRKLLASTIREDKLTIISTHEVHNVESIIDAVLILDEGKIVLYQHMSELSKQFAFTMTSQEPSLSTCFYYEKCADGYAVLTLGHPEIEAQIDLEILFKAILANKNTLPRLVKTDSA